jgi:hypothetical protein
MTMAPMRPTTRSRSRHLARALPLALVLVTAVAGPAAAAEPRPVPTGIRTPTGTLASVERVDINLYRPYSVVRQYTSYWCVPASAQSMLNVIRGTTDRTRLTQSKYAWHIQRMNRYTYASRGNDPQGWARFLDTYVGGSWAYRDRAFPGQDAGIAAIAESIYRTRHPVGIVVDRGTHAWTVLGIRGSRRSSGTFIVEGVYVTGPLSGDPWPYRYLTLAEFRTRFSRYHESQRAVVWEGQYVIVSE